MHKLSSHNDSTIKNGLIILPSAQMAMSTSCRKFTYPVHLFLSMPDLPAFPRTRKTSRLQPLLCTVLLLQLLVLVVLLF
jgi:hypothetical protein